MKTIAIVTSKGGHLGQMRLLFTPNVLKENRAILVTEEKTESVMLKSFLKKYTTYFFKKDSLGFNPIIYIFRTISLFLLFRKECVNIVFTNGAQISIPAVIAAKLNGIKTVFIDTVIRVKTPNWSARVCYFFSDIFWVQHPNMALKYGRRARYVGGII